MAETKNFGELTFTDMDGKELQLQDLNAEVFLIVNTASKCGFTSQYSGLEKLWNTYKDKGLVVIGFPCNQFGNQEPGTIEEIKVFCTDNYQVSFPMSDKIKVNGDDTHPIFEHLKLKSPGMMGLKNIKWNFTKFLVSRDGEKVKRFGSMTRPNSMIKDIEAMLNN